MTAIRGGPLAQSATNYFYLKRTRGSDDEKLLSRVQSWALEVFLNVFNNKKLFVAYPISAPVLFKKPTPSQINLIKNCKKSFFIIEKMKKYRKCPVLARRNEL